MTTELSKLVDELVQKSAADPLACAEYLKSCDLEYQDIEPYCSWLEGSYTRNLVHRTDAFELIVICWEQESVSSLHDHNGHICAVRWIQGDLEEKVLSKQNGKPTLVTSGAFTNNNRCLVDNGSRIHSISNIGDKRAISVHLYMPPIDHCGVYNPDDGQLIDTKELTYSN